MDEDARIRIAHVVFGLGLGGLENGLVNLVSGLDRERFQHAIFCMKVLGPNAARAEAAGAQVELVGRPEARNRLIIPKLYMRFRRFRPHVVHTRNFGTVDAIVAGRLARVPGIVHGEHGWDTADMDGADPRPRSIRRFLAPSVRRFIAVSEDIGAWLADHGEKLAGKITTIHNGVDLERFQCDRKLDSAREIFLVGTIGRLTPVKDQGALIEAFDIIAARHDHVRLLIVGGGELDSSLRAAAQAASFSERIEIRAPTDDASTVYPDMDLFVLPSLNEGISNTILEAMASGLAVVATRVGGNPELVVDGETGALVPPSNPRELAAALEVYATNPQLARTHGAAGRARAEKSFSLDRMCEAYEDLYCDVGQKP